MIYEDEYVYVGHIDQNGHPNYLGHIMIDLKRHAPTLGDLNLEEEEAFGVKDSTTIVSWRVDISKESTKPSNNHTETIYKPGGLF